MDICRVSRLEKGAGSQFDSFMKTQAYLRDNQGGFRIPKPKPLIEPSKGFFY
jgi:hypothetical protein